MAVERSLFIQNKQIICLALGGIELSHSFPFLIVYFRQIPVMNVLIPLQDFLGNANSLC